MANSDAPVTAEFILSQESTNVHLVVMSEAQCKECLERESAAILALFAEPVGSSEIETTPEQRARPCGFNGDGNGCWQRVSNDEGSMNNRINNSIGLETQPCTLADFKVLMHNSFCERYLRLYRYRHPEIYHEALDHPLTQQEVEEDIDKSERE